MSVLAKRFLFGTLLLVGAGMFLWFDKKQEGTAGFFTLCLIFVAVGWVEYCRMVGLRDRVQRWIGLVCVVGTMFAEWWLLSHGTDAAHFRFLALVSVVLPGVLCVASFRHEPSRDRLHEIALATLGCVYLLFPVICFLQLYAGDGGLMWAFLVILVVKGNDIGAFLTGRFLGRTPLSRISPKKTWEGAVGGATLGCAITVAFAVLGDLDVSVGIAIAIGLAGGISGQVGDLAESYLKRSFDIKDSGALVPAFGGSLDIMDSVLYAAPVLYLVRLAL